MACIDTVFSNLTDEVYEKASRGLGMNIRNAKALARNINKEYGHDVVSFTLTEDIVDMNVDISTKMLDEYFCK